MMSEAFHMHKLIAIWCILLTIVFVVNGIMTLNQITKQQNISKKIVSLRTPTIYASLSMDNHVNKALASLRGWLLLKENHFDEKLRESWINIRNTENKMEVLSDYWTNPQNQERFKKIQTLLNDFNKTQFEILEISRLPENFSAQRLLTEEVIPLSSTLNDKVTSLINFEESLEGAQQNLEMLADLIQLRNAMRTKLVNIGAYVSSKNKNFIPHYELARKDSQRSIDALISMKNDLNPFQQHVLTEIIQHQKTFHILADKIFQIQEQTDWNQAVYLLKTQAVPMSQQIISILDDMVENQHQLQQKDYQTLLEISTYSFRESMLFIAFFVILISTWLGFQINRRATKAQNESNNKAQLIDQNIMIAYLDNNGFIKDISNSLCRELDGVKTDFIGKQSYFFLNDQAQNPLFKTILNAVKTGQVWEGEIARIGYDNKQKWFYSKLIPTNQYDYRDKGYSNILYNITDKKYLEKISILDKLTGLFNRRHFDHVIKQQFRLTRRHSTSLALCILDIDYFKDYNDYYGHQAGDNALSLVAQTVQKCLKRPDDFVFRLGGEEFAVILRGLEKTQVSGMLKEIQKNIQDLKIKHINNKVYRYLTISIGAKIYDPIDTPTVADFYQAADTSLYEAKKKRNSIIIK